MRRAMRFFQCAWPTCCLTTFEFFSYLQRPATLVRTTEVILVFFDSSLLTGIDYSSLLSRFRTHSLSEGNKVWRQEFEADKNQMCRLWRSCRSLANSLHRCIFRSREYEWIGRRMHRVSDNVLDATSNHGWGVSSDAPFHGTVVCCVHLFGFLHHCPVSNAFSSFQTCKKEIVSSVVEIWRIHQTHHAA